MTYLPKGIAFHLNYNYETDQKDYNVWCDKCYHKGKSLVICQNEIGNIFGGYTDLGFGSHQGGTYKVSNNVFIFYLDKKTNELKVLKVLTKEKAQYWYYDYGVAFGIGHTFIIYRDFLACHRDEHHSFQNPPGGSFDFTGERSGVKIKLVKYETFCEEM